MNGSVSALGSEYDEFLYAPIFRDGSEMVLSVVSMLARLDIDPWQEAARLARLPKEAAASSLASLIAKKSGGLPRNLDATAIAVRLIGLLPSLSAAQFSQRAASSSAATVSHPRTLIFVLFVLLLLGIQYVAANRQNEAPTVADHVAAGVESRSEAARPTD